jgi:hypothetical protein
MLHAHVLYIEQNRMRIVVFLGGRLRIVLLHIKGVATTEDVIL